MFAISRQSSTAFEIRLIKEFQMIDSLASHPVSTDSTNSYDTLVAVNRNVLSRFLSFCSSNKESIRYPFNSLLDLTIINSEDHRCRTYSWDSYTGGTMHIYYSFAQFLTANNKLSTQLLSDTSTEGGDPGLWYCKIYTLKNSGHAYCLCIGSGRYSTADLGFEVNIYTVKGSLLVQAPIIRSKTGLTNRIHVDYNFFKLTKETDDHSIEFDSSSRKMYIPLVNDKGEMSKKYIIYKFNGTYFQKLGIEDKKNLLSL
jgi:hypothetical protein